MTSVVEVGPRDGLQNEARVLDPTRRIRFINDLASTGVTRIEAVSFVSPQAVPQMADAEMVMEGIERTVGVSVASLALNDRGVARAIAADVDECNVVVVATDTFSRQNQGFSTDESLDALPALVSDLQEAEVLATVTIGASFGCPFEGEVPLSRLSAVIQRVLAAKPDELALADTIGVAVPRDVRAAVRLLRDLTDLPLRLHLHNTRNTGYANAVAAMELGVETLDASAGGLGGCPFAPDATGNIATEDLHYLLERSGIPPGYDRSEVAAIAAGVAGDLAVNVPGQLGRAGGFPPEVVHEIK